MSDEERDVDILDTYDSDDDDDSFTEAGRSSDQFSSHVDKRAHHNALERKRRDHIKDSFVALRDSIPLIRGQKASRAHILKRSAGYIEFMCNKWGDDIMDLDLLLKQNEVFDEQVKSLGPELYAKFLAMQDENSDEGKDFVPEGYREFVEERESREREQPNYDYDTDESESEGELSDCIEDTTESNKGPTSPTTLMKISSQSSSSALNKSSSSSSSDSVGSDRLKSSSSDSNGSDRCSKRKLSSLNGSDKHKLSSSDRSSRHMSGSSESSGSERSGKRFKIE